MLFRSLQRAGKIQEAVARLDTVIAKYPEMRVPLLRLKFDMLAKTDSVAATKLAREIGDKDFKDEPVLLNLLAWTFVDPEGYFKDPDYDLAISLASRAVELTKEKDAAILDTLALAHFKAGHRDEAIALQQKAVDIARQPGSRLDPQTKKDIEDRLAMFKKAQ